MSSSVLAKLNRVRSSLKGRTVLVTGASRGIGREVALACARKEADVFLVARSLFSPSHSSLSGSLLSVKEEVERQGARCGVLELDVEGEEAGKEAVEGAVGEFGRLDAVVCNASTIDLRKQPSIHSFTRMANVNARGTAGLILASLPHLSTSDVGHVLSVSPPLSTLSHRWLLPHPSYTFSKYGMTMLTLGFSDVARCNTLWPKKLISTAATKMLEERHGIEGFSKGKDASPFADKVVRFLMSDASGVSCLDDEVERVGEGVEDIFTCR